MKIRDYRHANCELYREPIIDLSSIDPDIVTILMQAWQKGSSPNHAIDYVLGGEIGEELRARIQPNIALQRKIALGELDAEATAKLEETERDRARRLEQIERNYMERTRPLEEEAQRTKRYLEEHTTALNATQARMRELHLRINERLRTLGGKSGVERLKRAAYHTLGEELDIPLEERAGEAGEGLEGKLEEPKREHRGPFHSIYTALRKFVGYFRR